MHTPVVASPRSFDVENLLGVVAFAAQSAAACAPDWPRDASKSARVVGGRRDVPGNRSAGDDMVWRERRRLNDAPALGKIEVDVAKVHQIHRRGGEIGNLHHDVTPRVIWPQHDARRRKIMRAKPHRVFSRPRHGDPGALRVDPTGDARLIHFRAGHFAMQDMIVGSAVSTPRCAASQRDRQGSHGFRQ